MAVVTGGPAVGLVAGAVVGVAVRAAMVGVWVAPAGFVGEGGAGVSVGGPGVSVAVAGNGVSVTGAVGVADSVARAVTVTDAVAVAVAFAAPPPPPPLPNAVISSATPMTTSPIPKIAPAPSTVQWRCTYSQKPSPAAGGAAGRRGGTPASPQGEGRRVV